MKRRIKEKGISIGYISLGIFFILIAIPLYFTPLPLSIPLLFAAGFCFVKSSIKNKMRIISYLNRFTHPRAVKIKNRFNRL